MPVFIVVATKSADEIDARIVELSAPSQDAKLNRDAGIDSYFRLKVDTWFVRFQGTTRALAEALGIRKGETGSGVVLGVEGFSGRAPSETWEWLRVNMLEDS